eukprot:4165632-Lingulodinium_polyedra.AAC.1
MGPGERRGAMVVYIRKGALPAVFCEARRAGGLLGFKVGIQTGAMVLAHLHPDYADAVGPKLDQG